MNSAILILFLLYSVIIVFIENIYIIMGLVLLEFLLLLLLKIKTRFKGIILFLLFIFIINMLLINISTSILITLRLLSMYLIVIIVISKIGVNNIASSFSKIFRSQNLYLIISIALTFVPIMKDEIFNIKKSLLVKNYSLNLINIIKNPKIIVVTFFHNLFARVSELEKTIIVSGFYD